MILTLETTCILGILSDVCPFILYQPGVFYRDVLNAEEKDRLCRNIAGHLMNAVDFIQERAVSAH